MLAKHNAERRAKASEILSKHGYCKMKDMVSKGISQHESHDHKGEKKTKLKLATGGAAKGEAPHNRMDRKPRAAGGRNKHNKEPRVAVNVIKTYNQGRIFSAFVSMLKGARYPPTFAASRAN